MAATYPISRALVLGPGGLPGTAWMAGLVHGLLLEGVDPGEADLVVGTSAGAIVGAALRGGGALGRLAEPVSGDRPPAVPAVPAGPLRVGEVYGVLGTPGLAPEEKRRRVGRIAMESVDPLVQRELLAGRRAMVGTEVWPDRPLLIPAVDAVSGEPVVWDRDSGVPLVEAVAASSAFPGTAPPIAVGGRHYMDGALRAGSNEDLAAGAGTLLLIEPLARQFPRPPQDDGRTVVTLAPDEASLRAFGNDPGDRSAWVPSFRAGLAQAAQEHERLREAWGTSAR